MKWIVSSLGAMKIQLNPYGKLVKRRPYHLNPKYKEKVCKERFYKMKGIINSLGAMKIQLKPDAKLVKRSTYHLNLKYKEKVHKELDWMLDVGVIVPIE